MAWVYLVLAGIFEIGWPVGLKLGWSTSGVRAWPLTASLICLLLSGTFLLLAQRTIPMGTAYAVWTGLGAVGTFIVGIVFFGEPAQVARCVCVGLIASGIIGLRVFS